MAKVKIQGRDKAQRNIGKFLSNVIKTEGIYKGTEEIVKDVIRSGKKPSDGGKYKSLPKGKGTWHERRQKLAKKNKTHPEYSPNKSNLTFTGQLVESIISNFVEKTATLEIFVDPKSIHKGYRQLNGKRSKSVKNTDIAEGLEDLGYPLLESTVGSGKSKGAIKEITKKIKNRLASEIQKRLQRL